MLRRLAVVSVVAVLCFVVAGCYSVNVCAPAGADVSLAPEGTSMAFKKEIKGWYVLWGLVPLIGAKDGVQAAIKDNNLTNVRVETKTTFVDWLISAVLGSVTVGTRTIIVEGTAN